MLAYINMNKCRNQRRDRHAIQFLASWKLCMWVFLVMCSVELSGTMKNCLKWVWDSIVV